MNNLQRELSKIDTPLTDLLDLFALFFGDAFGQAARDGGAGVDFAPADDLHHTVTILARLDHFTADFQTDFVDHTQDIPLCNRCIRSHDEIRTASA